MFNNGIGLANDHHLTKETLRMVFKLPSRRWVILALMMLVLCRPRRGYKQMQQLRQTVPQQSAFRSNRSQTFPLRRIHQLCVRLPNLDFTRRAFSDACGCAARGCAHAFGGQLNVRVLGRAGHLWKLAREVFLI